MNAARYPARTATTATALLIGVLLVATVLTGQHVARVNLLNELDQNRPVDISVPASAGQVSPEQVRQISELNGVLGVKSTDPADADGAIIQIDAAQSLNNSSAEGAPRQTVVNGWHQVELAEMMAQAGWQAVGWRNLSHGIVALHRGIKP